MSEKIKPSHIERDAYVYIRQSSMQQVRTRLEGQRRQYDLRERALALGFQRVVVIDEDQGRSGTGSVERPGFGRLLAAVCSGKVGAVLAFEASRLARNNRDWHHLIDLCAMAGTLVIDHDGIYDPSLLNDRLLLGLKGTMSEFEISLLRQRAMEARRQTADPCTLARVRSPQGDLDRTDLSPYFRTSEKPNLRRCLRLGKKPYSHFHRGWTRTQDTRPRATAAAVGSYHSESPRRVYYVGRVYAQPATDPRQRRLECTHGKCEWRSEKRSRIAGGIIAL